MALPSLISSSLTSCLRSSRTAPAPQPLSLLPSPKTMLFKTHSREVRKHSRFLVTHGSGLRAPNSHLLCSVMLLDKRFARPHADLHHRPKSNWSCVRRQGHDFPRSFSRDCLDNTSCFPPPPRVLSHPKTPLSCSSSAASVGIVPHGQWAHHDKLRLALIDPVSETRGAIPLFGLSLHHRDACAHTLRCCAHATSYSCLWRPKLHCKSASGRPVFASCPVAIWSFSPRTSTLAFSSMAGNLLHS